MGFFHSGKFNLVVSVRYAPQPNETAFLCQLFEQVSRILHDATDGQQAIGNVMIATDSLAGDTSDVWLHPNDDVWPNSTSARLWFNGESLDISQDFTYFATILAHELSHYLYDVRDEYNNGSTCQGSIATQASMMEGYGWNLYTRWTDSGGTDYADFATFFADFTAGTATLQIGEPSEFCHDGNHNSTANNNQNNINDNRSCWSWMADDPNHGDIPYGLTAPGAAGPASAPPSPLPTPIVCTELIPEQRYMLVLDRSASMSGVPIEQLRIGGNFWVDYVNPGEVLGIVKYSGTANLVVPSSEVPAAAAAATTWRNDRHAIVDAITAGGSTAIGDALRVGLNDIIAGGLAASQVMILFTDGLQNTGTETAEEVLPDIIAANVKVYTIGLGTDQNASLLSLIAESTSGRYFAIASDIDAIDGASAVTDALVKVGGESRENSGIVSFDEIDGASVGDTFVLKKNALPFSWHEKEDEPGQPSGKPPIRAFTFPVQITQGSKHCTIGAMWQLSTGNLRIKVFDPNGAVVAAGPGKRFVSAVRRYSFFEIDNPVPGKWTVEVSGSRIRTTKFRTIGFELHDLIRLEVSAFPRHIKAGAEIKLRARLFYGVALPNAELIAIIRTPSGKWLTEKFHENTGTTAEKEEALMYTLTVKTPKNEVGQYLMLVKAYKKKEALTYKLDELYAKKPGLQPAQKERKVAVPQFSRQKFLSVVATQEEPRRTKIVPGYNTKPPRIPERQAELLKKWKKAHKKSAGKYT